MEANNLIGKLIDGRYEMTRVIGQGGMGAVYEAQHTGTGRRVAVKVISTGDLTKDAQLVGRFQREAKAAGAIDTQHICQVLDTGTDGETGWPYMVMEFMSGEDVQHLVRRVGPVTADLALRIVAQACLGLQKAHSVEVVHRDIKPANLFLARSDGGNIIVKLLDFGIAKVKMETAQEAGDAGLTRTGTMLGSPLYMSPEQARGMKTIDHRADIWSLGVVLYELLTGRTPYHHIEALGELIIAICSEPPRPVQEFAPWCPPEVAQIVHRALRAQVSERYQTASEMFDAIKALLPYGTSIDESMLNPLSQADRDIVAQRLSLTPPPDPRIPTNVPARSVPPPGFAGAATIQGGPPDGSAGTTAGIATPTDRAPAIKPKSSLPMLLAGLAIGVVLIGGIGYKMLSDQQNANATTTTAPTPTQKPTPKASQTASQATLAPTPTVTPGASSSAPSIAPAPEEKKFNLGVFPADAEVTIDGTVVTVQKNEDGESGTVEVKGTLGSGHTVVVKLKDEKIEKTVYITENGASPATVMLQVKGRPAPKMPTGPTTGPASTGGPAPTGKKGPGIDTDFGN